DRVPEAAQQPALLAPRRGIARAERPDDVEEPAAADVARDEDAGAAPGADEHAVGRVDARGAERETHPPGPPRAPAVGGCVALEPERAAGGRERTRPGVARAPALGLAGGGDERAGARAGREIDPPPPPVVSPPHVWSAAHTASARSKGATTSSTAIACMQ